MDSSHYFANFIDFMFTLSFLVHEFSQLSVYRNVLVIVSAYINHPLRVIVALRDCFTRSMSSRQLSRITFPLVGFCTSFCTKFPSIWNSRTLLQAR